MRTVGVIPARFASTRFPGKPLAPIAGIPMIARVVERALAASKLDRVIVATDHDGIAQVARSAGATAVLTDPDLPSGTDRVAAAVRGLDVDVDLVVNVQGDEPLLPPENIDSLVAAMGERPDVPMGTLRAALADESQIADPNVVKVVTRLDGTALYFSRSPVPYRRGAGTVHRHIGLYAYRRDALLRLAALAPTPLEAAEGLEQLRALENGMTILAVPTALDSPAVDVPSDVEKVERLLQLPAHAGSNNHPSGKGTG
jgi:3-deoxy-manno-octulosonate cytidylyltransferase (CMP-KDO synthetase)